MRKKVVAVVILAFAVLGVFSGCVSVSLKQKSAEKSTVMTFKAPSAPFSEMKTGKESQVDKSWSTPRGQTIAFYSECSEQNDPALDYLETEFANAINDHKNRSLSRGNFNERESLQSSTEGTVDGVPVKLKLLVFKKNFCSYVIMYSAKIKNFSEQEKAFQSFIESFKVY